MTDSHVSASPNSNNPPPAGSLIVPDTYPNIQAAVGNASAGDTIFVKKGIYKENVIVDKSLSLIGEDSKETVIKGRVHRYGPFYTIRVTADNVEISGFTITGTLTGISTEASGCKIIGNIVKNYGTGITTIHGVNHIISENNITGNLDHGIYIRSSNSVVSDNKISGNGLTGIILNSCANVTISGNSITGNDNGLNLRWDGPFYVYGNNITDNKGYGIQFGEGVNNFTVYQNNIMRNGIGVDLLNFRKGEETTIGLGHTFYRNNFVDNAQQAIVEQELEGAGDNPHGNGADVVSWDNSGEGNYWSDYQSRYPNASEVGTSGVGDTPYVIDENNVDRYPLMQPLDITPVA